MAHGTIIDGVWLVRPVAEFSDVWLGDGICDGWEELTVPGHWQLLNGMQNYTGKMIYKKEFNHEPIEDRIYRLKINGVFYRYHVFLNRFYLGSGEGYFVPAEFGITSLLRPGRNTLHIEVDSINESEVRCKSRLMGVYNGWMGLAPEKNPGGIWQPVEILESGPVYFRYWNLSTEAASLHSASLRLQINFEAATSQKVRLAFSMIPSEEEGIGDGGKLAWEWEIEAGSAPADWEAKLTVENPRLWWSWDLGKPFLYNACLELIGTSGETLDRVEFTTGIRHFELRKFIPYLNGQRFLAKGASYAPGDLYPAFMTPQRYLEDLQRAQAVHINMLRVYSHVESDAFYAAADRAGILLWQDTALFGRYRSSIYNETIRQTQAMVRRLGNHPAVVIWCMHEEPCGQGISLGEGYNKMHAFWRRLCSWKFSWNRDYLDRCLKRWVSRWDGTRPIISNTGQRGWMLDCNGHLTYGWLPGHGPKRRLDWIRHGIGRRRLRFVTQIGGQRLRPDHETIHFSAAAGEALNWDRHPMRSRTPERETLNNRPALETEKDVQVDLLRFYIDRLRYHKYRPTGGILGPFLQAPHPLVYPSLIVGSKTLTPAFAALALAYRPVYVFTMLDKDQYYRGETVEAPICLASDRMEAKGVVEIKARLTGPSGDLVWKGRWELMPEPDMETLEIARASVLLTRSGEYKLHLSWDDGELTENIYFIPVKAFRHHSSSII